MRGGKGKGAASAATGGRWLPRGLHLSGLERERVSRRVVDNYREYEQQLMRTLRASNVEQFRVAVTAGALVTVWVVSVFGRQIRRFFSTQTAEVARETLENEELQARTQELAAAVVRTILNDEDILLKLTNFVKRAAGDAVLRGALVDMAVHIVQHEETLAEVKVLGLRLVDHLLASPQVTEQAGELVQRVWALENVRKATLDVLVELLQDEQVYEATLTLLRRVSEEDAFRDKVKQVLVGASYGVVGDEGVHKAAKNFVHEVVSDSDVQRTGGRSLRATVWYSLEPALGKVMSFGALIGSVLVVRLYLGAAGGGGGGGGGG